MNRMATVIKVTREQIGLSRAELANEAGVSNTIVYNIEVGAKSADTLKFGTLRKLADALNLPLEYLIISLLWDIREEETKKK